MDAALTAINAGDGDDAAVDDFLKILEEHRRACERQGKYVEAEVARKRLEELKAHEQHRRREGLRSKQIAERLGLEEAHMSEYQQLNGLWDGRMEEYDRKAVELEEAMRARHNHELDELRMKLVRQAPKPKFSKDLLNLRKVQDSLAKQKEYVEAHKVKLKADEMEIVEMESINMNHQGRIGLQEDKLAYKQQQELEALRLRVHSGREDHERQRKVDLQRLLLRYQNVKVSLEKSHNLEKSRAERELSRVTKGLNYGSAPKHSEPFANLTSREMRGPVSVGGVSRKPAGSGSSQPMQAARKPPKASPLAAPVVKGSTGRKQGGKGGAGGRGLYAGGSKASLGKTG